jgi:hypothetical protein
MCMCTYVYMYVHVCVYICVVYMHVCVCVCVCVGKHSRVLSNIFVSLFMTKRLGCRGGRQP